MKRTSYFILGTWAGVFTASGIAGLRQDYMGKEAYSQHVLTHWVPEHVSVPIEIGFLLVAVLVAAFIGHRSAHDEYIDRKSQY